MPLRKAPCLTPARKALGTAVLCLAAAAGNPAAQAAGFSEDFSNDPATTGWARAGDTNLFRWDPAGRALQVTWDSSRTNSFLLHRLGTMLTKADDFSFSFDVRLQDIRVGSNPEKPSEFEIAVGLIHHGMVTNQNAYRGAGLSTLYGVRNLVEFDYLPDAGFGDTVATTMVSTNNRIFPVHNFPLSLTPGDLFRFTLAYTAADQTVRTHAWRNGQPYGLPPDHTLASLPLAGLPDFAVDAFSVTSYSDAIQTGPSAFHGSVLAHGTLDNVEVVLAAPPIQQLRLARIGSGSSQAWQAVFLGAANWSYTLERTTNRQVWVSQAGAQAGPAREITLVDTNPPPSSAAVFYRVRAEKP